MPVSLRDVHKCQPAGYLTRVRIVRKLHLDAADVIAWHLQTVRQATPVKVPKCADDEDPPPNLFLLSPM